MVVIFFSILRWSYYFLFSCINICITLIYFPQLNQLLCLGSIQLGYGVLYFVPFARFDLLGFVQDFCIHCFSDISLIFFSFLYYPSLTLVSGLCNRYKICWGVSPLFLFFGIVSVRLELNVH